MPKDIPVGDLIKEAERQCKQLEGFADVAPKSATRLEAGFKKDKPDLDWITQEIETDEKWIESVEYDVAKAEKTLKQLLKAKEAEAKKPAKELDAALEDARKEIEKLRNTLGVAEKIAEKAETDDKRLAPIMAHALQLAAQRINELRGDKVDCPKVVEHMANTVDKILADEFPVRVYIDRVPVFVRDMKMISGHLTAAEELSKSLEALAKRGAKAFLPEVQQNVEKCPAVKKQLDELTASVRAEYVKGINASNEWRQSLDYKIKNAA
jgi:septation ring formation regulator EzrA